MKRNRVGLLLALACTSPNQDEPNLAPSPEDKSGFTHTEPGGFPINYNREIVPSKKTLLGKSDLVIGLAADGQARAYPINFMTGPSNQVINDHFGGISVAITWSSLDYSAIVFERTLDHRPYHLGVLGMEDGLAILYDRQTRSRWQQLSGNAVSGKMDGERLRKLPSIVTPWEKWVGRYPETTVYVNRQIPYRPQFTSATIRELAKKPAGPLTATDLVLALELRDEAKAYPLKRLSNDRIVNDKLGQIPVLVVLSEDLSTARVYDRRANDRSLNFEQSWFGGTLLDRETGSEWDILTGAGLDGPLKGTNLRPVAATIVLWYAWKSYRPDSDIYGES